MPGPSNPRLFGGGQPMSQVGGRPPMGRPGMPTGGMSQRPGMPQRPGGGQQISPQQLAAKELMLKSELLKVQAIKALMGGGGTPGGRRRQG